jgi:hypothetical protein
MSNEAWFGVAMALANAVILLVWRTAVVTTSHRMRIEALEKEASEIVELRKHLWTLDRRSEVRAARASAGQFDQGKSSPPGGM